MAKARKNLVVEGLSGSIWELVFRQMPDGSTRVSQKPDFSKRVFSQGQKDHQRRFQEAVAYAREAAKSQPVYAELAKGTTKNAYNWALSDWFNPPIIHSVERKDGMIRVEASDNVKVARVQVRVLDEAGHVLEEGDAQQLNPGSKTRTWTYPSDTQGKIEVCAWDLAGNTVKTVL